MVSRHKPWFRIHRVDTPTVENLATEEDLETPDTHYRAFWTIEDKTYRVHIWNDDEWERQTPVLPHAAEARSLDGRGWMSLQEIARR